MNKLITQHMVHIFSQEAFHDDVYIVGTKEGLERLRNIIDEAIQDSYGVSELCVNDGEGYSIAVNKINETEVDKIAVPYSADYAKEKRAGAIYPWQL